MQTDRVIGLPKPQLALAMAIVKQKPAETVVKDYILQLRAFVKQRKENNHFLGEQFFDSISFWQLAYENAQAEQTKLLDTIYELEQRNQTLLAKICDNSNLDMESQSSKKRKVAGSGFGENLENSTDSRKRSRGQPRNPRPLATSKTGRAESDNEEAETESPSLLRALYTMQRALQNRRSSSILTILAVTLCKTSEQELLTAVVVGNGGPDSEKARRPSLTPLIKGIELAFDSVHRTLHKIANAKDGAQFKGQMTYYIVCLFESTLTALTQHCAKEAASENPKTKAVSGKKTAQQTRRREDQSPSKEKIETAQCLTDLLFTMVQSLDLARPEDKEVIEGFLFVVFNRVGKLLAYFTFVDWGPFSADCPISSSPEGFAVVMSEKLTVANAQLEARCLLNFLDKVLGHDSGMSTLHSEFLLPIKDRLQKSLLEAVFGKNDPSFKEGLSRPATPPPQHCDPHQLEDLEGSEWFVQGLWRLVGWDMLSTLVNKS